MIAILDYGMGNLRSVEKAFLKVGHEAKVVSSPGAVEDAAAVVLPGVGAFRDCMRNLAESGLDTAVVKSIEKGKPFLGICLGLQLLFTESEEFGASTGLDIYRGKVVRFPSDGLKVPHMGWNGIKISRRPPMLENIPDGTYFYFVHSYYVVPDDASITAAQTEYGKVFTSMIWKDNVCATQFHPEKSQTAGLEFLRAFGNWTKKGA